jgi:hypothetical protein
MGTPWKSQMDVERGRGRYKEEREEWRVEEEEVQLGEDRGGGREGTAKGADERVGVMKRWRSKKKENSAWVREEREKEEGEGGGVEEEGREEEEEEEEEEEGRKREEKEMKNKVIMEGG